MGEEHTNRQDDAYEAYALGDGIYWVGFADWTSGFSNNPYLLVSDDDAVLIDPGSVLHYHVVAKKVLQLVEPERLSAIVLLHQDPDLCASVPRFEALISHPIRVITHSHSVRLLPYYGIMSEFVTPAHGETLRLAGRSLQFFHTPYVHFAGAMMAWDADSRTLFASDVFAGVTTNWTLFADASYVEATRPFAEDYFGSAAAWEAALAIARRLKPARICPQHGSIIQDDVDAYLDAVSQFRVARLLRPHEPQEDSP